MKSATSRVKSFVHMFFSKARFGSTYTAKNLRASRLQVEMLESRVQPSFLTGGLDLGAGLGADFGDDLLNNGHHHNDHLAALASALATSQSTNAASSTSVASSGAINPASQGNAPQAGSQTAAELSALSAAARNLGLGSGGGISNHSRGGLTSTAATLTNTPVVSSVTNVQSQLSPLTLTGQLSRDHNRGVHPPSLTWATEVSDPITAQGNSVVAGVGASAGLVFYGGFLSDPAGTGNTLAAVAAANIADGSHPGGFVNTLTTATDFNYLDAVNHIALSPDGSILYAAATISDYNAPNFYQDGFVAAFSVDPSTSSYGQLIASGGFMDAKLNGIAVTGTTASYNVVATGAVPNTTRTNGSDILVAGFNSGLTALNYGFSYGYTLGGVAVDSAGLVSSQDSSGAQYIGGTLAGAAETNGFYAKFDATGANIWNGAWANVNPGPNGAVNGVYESAGFLYMTGNLNNQPSPGPYGADMILAKVTDSAGTTTGGGYGFRWLNQDASGARSGDLPGEAIVVRGGTAYTAGGNFDTSSTGLDGESAIVLHFGPTGGTLSGLEEYGGNGLDNAYGIDFASSAAGDVVWAGASTSTDLVTTDGSVYGGGSQDGWSARSVVA